LFGLTELFLLVDQKSVSVFEGVFSSAFEMVDDFGPFLLSIVVVDEGKQLDVFFDLPGSLFNLGIQVAVPVFSALFCTPEDFLLALIDLVLLFSNEFPVDGVGVDV
jgi:hypothetical protein